MNCQQMKPWLTPYALGELKPDATRRVEEHVV